MPSKVVLDLVAGAMSGGDANIVYIHRDEFTTNAAAPLTTPRTEEPGPGTLTIVDASNVWSIAGSKLTCSGTPAAKSPIATSAKLTHIAGQLASVEVAWTAGRPFLGLHTAAPTYDNGFCLQVLSNTRIDMRANGNGVGTIFGSIPAKFHLIKRQTAGMFFLCDTSLVWVNTTGNSDMFAGVGPQDGVASNFTMDGFRVTNLAAPWKTDAGIATNIVASPGANEVTSQLNNAIVEMTHTMVTNDVWNLMVRRTDDDNTWIVRCDQANSKIYLYEKQTGTETERGATGGVAQTWTNATAYRVVVTMDGNTIKVYTETGAGASTALKITYSSATFNSSATGVKTDLAGSNLITWPRVITGLALSELSKTLNP